MFILRLMDRKIQLNFKLVTDRLKMVEIFQFDQSQEHLFDLKFSHFTKSETFSIVLYRQTFCFTNPLSIHQISFLRNHQSQCSQRQANKLRWLLKVNHFFLKCFLSFKSYFSQLFFKNSWMKEKIFTKESVVKYLNGTSFYK